MKVVLLSGGSGKRLWPMSNDSRSKQFLKVLTNEAGQRVSMLQRVWSQLAASGLADDAYICAPKAQYDIIESQVGRVNFVEEPSRRDTFPAIALATTYLSNVVGLSDDEVVTVIPVDPFVDETYFHTIQRLETALRSSGAGIALMGVKPTDPTSKFGYIRIMSDTSGSALYQDVLAFAEKPGRDVASTLITEGALWNCGVFAFHLGFLKNWLECNGFPSDYYRLSEIYPLLPKRSFDYEVVEKTKKIVVIPYEGAWEDIGTWATLSTRMGESFVGKGTSLECSNTHVINELGVPLVAMGLHNVMLVATPDGILAAEKEMAAGIKSVISEYPSYPMYEERAWGSYRVLDYQKLGDGKEILTKFVVLKHGKNLSYQKHTKRTETWTFVKGHGEVIVNSDVQSVRAGDVIRVAPGVWHTVCASESLQFVEVQCGTELTEDDIFRSELSWSEILNHAAATVG